MGHQRLSRALSGTQWHSPAAVVVEPYLAKEIARGVVYLERLILGVCVVEDFEPEGVPDEGGNQRRQSEDFEPEGVPDEGGNQKRQSEEAIREALIGIQDPEAGGVHAVEVYCRSREAKREVVTSVAFAHARVTIRCVRGGGGDGRCCCCCWRLGRPMRTRSQWLEPNLIDTAACVDGKGCSDPN
jgi:hypothetical protein